MILRNPKSQLSLPDFRPAASARVCPQNNSPFQTTGAGIIFAAHPRQLKTLQNNQLTGMLSSTLISGVPARKD